MARYPGAAWRPVDRYRLGQRLAVPMVRYDAVVGHTAVSAATPSMHSYFNVSGRATPHVHFGRDGECEQYIDTDLRSSAVLNGNHRCITWEAWDGFPDAWSADVCPPYTDAQVEAMAQFCAWVHETHGVPLVQMPNSRPESQGIGWHRLGIDGNFPQIPGRLLGGRVTGGETWTLSTGKTCPTDLRIAQFPKQIIPRAIEISEGDDMPTADEIAAAVWARQITPVGSDTKIAAAQMLRQIHNRTAGIKPLAAAVAQADPSIDQGALERALAKVLGSLDE